MKNIFIIILLTIFQISFSQKKDENIGTEVVNVVKSYTPTISDANKIKEVPDLSDIEVAKKVDVKYEIFSFPVASTFTPNKGKAAVVEKAKAEKLFSNYATLGFGNFASINAELFATYEIDNYQYLVAKISHQSAQNSIKNSLIDNKFAETYADVFYKYQRTNTKFSSEIGYKTESYNWYGLPIANTNFNPLLISNFNPLHKFNTLKLDSELVILDSFFKNLKVDFISFSDSYKSLENRFIIKPEFNLNFDDININTKIGVDYLNTDFKSSFLTSITQVGINSNIKTSNLIFNINPSFQLLKEDLSAEIGIDITLYSRAKDIFSGVDAGSTNKFYVYPKINASYKLVDNIMIAFAGAEGKLIQNSYADFANINKFLSPTLSVIPTDQQYDIFAGLRGKLSNSVNYNVKGSYNASKNKALFKTNPNLQAPIDNYSFGNSFTVVYDNVNTATLFGELKADINKNIALGLSAEYNNYNTQFEARPWNLPMFKTTFMSSFSIGQKWSVGSQLFYVGERKDEFTNLPFVVNTNAIQTLDSYFDINFSVDYKYNNRISAFLKGNNLANQNYNRWLNYPVFGAQVILGASYKFDF